MLIHYASMYQPSSPTETPHKDNYISKCKLDEDDLVYISAELDKCSHYSRKPVMFFTMDKWLKWRSNQCKRSGCFGSSCAIGNFFPPLISKWILCNTHFICED